MKENKEILRNFLCDLNERGLKGVQLFIGDKCLGPVDALSEVYLYAKYHRCMVHFYRDVFSVTPRTKVRALAAMLKAIHALEKFKAVTPKLRG
ncbi:transposase [Limisalsivibrio acetivorans]|uniref:transposase n=1 Tax=Limisalsivibrio acetivorans TaxID=1304888 RepID=UPI0004166DBF|nr:transposase [Limisalsivibrio acetivorans]